MRNHLWFGTINSSQNKLTTSSKRFVSLLSASIYFLSITNSHCQKAEDIIDNPLKNKTIPGHGMSQAEYPFDEDGFYRKEWVSTTAKSPVKSSTTYKLPIPITSEEHSNYALFAKGTLKEVKEKAKTPVQETPSPVTPGNSLSKKSDAPSPAELGNQIVPAMFVMTDAEAKDQGFIGPYSMMMESAPTSKILVAKQTTVEKPAQAATRKETPAVTTPSKPVSTPAKPATVLATQTTKPSSPTIVNTASVLPAYHQVGSGDTLYSISRKYGVSVDALRKENGLTSDLIRIGQSLRLVLAQHALGVVSR